MSTATLLAAKAEGTLETYGEYGNAWGYQPFVWTALTQKYVPNAGPSMFGWEECFNTIWGGMPLRPWELNTFIMSFDEYYIQGRTDVETWVESMKKFEQAYGQPNRICHIPRIVTDLGEALDEGYEYFAWYGSTVNANVWQIPDHETETRRPYNIVKDAGATLYERATAKAQRFVPRSLDMEWVTLQAAA